MIDKAKASEALKKCVQSELLTPSAGTTCANMIEEGRGFADILLKLVGPEATRRYLMESFVEYLELSKAKIPFETLSLPEAILLEAEQPWHQYWKKIGSVLTPQAFEEEAAEPWHPSLRSIRRKDGTMLFQPDPKVSGWFNQHQGYMEASVRILATVYKEEPVPRG